MNSWNIKAPEFPVEFFGAFAPVDVLIEFDVPLTFTSVDAHGSQLLAHCISEAHDGSIRYFVAPTTDNIVSQLKSGIVSLTDALDQPMTWVVDVILEERVVAAWRVPMSSMPENKLPQRNVLLYPHLEPLIRLTAKGDTIVPGNIPGSLIKQIISNVERSLKILADFVVEQSNKTGRPSESFRRLYALGTQDISFSSISVAFRDPRDRLSRAGLFDKTADSKDDNAAEFDRVVEMLSNGVQWLSEQTTMTPDPPEGGTEEQRAILEAVKLLTPSSHGPAVEYQISGSVVDNSKVVRFNHDARLAVNNGLRKARTAEPTVFDEVGEIRELDQDFLTFHLRKIDDANEQKCSFSIDVLDEAMDAFNGPYRVRVIGEKASPTSIPHIIMVTPEKLPPAGNADEPSTL